MTWLNRLIEAGEKATLLEGTWDEPPIARNVWPEICAVLALAESKLPLSDAVIKLRAAVEREAKP